MFEIRWEDFVKPDDLKLDVPLVVDRIPFVMDPLVSTRARVDKRISERFGTMVVFPLSGTAPIVDLFEPHWSRFGVSREIMPAIGVDKPSYKLKTTWEELGAEFTEAKKKILRRTKNVKYWLKIIEDSADISRTAAALAKQLDYASKRNIFKHDLTNIGFDYYSNQEFGHHSNLPLVATSWAMNQRKPLKEVMERDITDLSISQMYMKPEERSSLDSPYIKCDALVQQMIDDVRNEGIQARPVLFTVDDPDLLELADYMCSRIRERRIGRNKLNAGSVMLQDLRKRIEKDFIDSGCTAVAFYPSVFSTRRFEKFQTEIAPLLESHDERVILKTACYEWRGPGKAETDYYYYQRIPI